MTVAINDQTGEVLVFDGTGWKPPTIAENDRGERIFYDGQGWKPMPAPPQRDLATAGEPPTPAPSMGPADAAAKPVPPRMPSAMEGLTNSGPNLARGVQVTGQALGNLAGAPVDIATAGINAGASLAGLPQIQKPIGGSQSIRELAAQGAEAVGFPLQDTNAATGPQRLLDNAQRMATEALAGGALMRGAGALLPASRTAQTLAAPYTEAIQIQQGARPVIGDLAAGAGSGVAVTGVEQGPYADNPLAHLFASLIGGVGGATAARVATAPVQTAKSVIQFNAPDRAIGPDPATGYQPSQRVGGIARQMAQDLAVDPKRAAQTITDEASLLRGMDVPENALPTTGLMSDDPGLIAAERADRMRRPDKKFGGGTAPAEFAQRDRAVAGEASRSVQSLSPGDNVDPRTAQRFVEADVAQQRQAVQQPLTKAQQEAEALRQQNAEALTQAQAGREQQLTGADARVAQLGQQVEQAATAEADLGGRVAGRAGSETAASEALAKQVAAQKASDEARKTGLYAEAADLGKSTQLDPAPLADAAKAVRAEISPLAGQDPKLNNILGDLERLGAKQEAPREAAGFVPQAPEAPPAPQTISARDLVDMLPRLSQAREAASRLMRGDVSNNLKTITDNVRGQLNSLADSGDAAALKWREAEANFRDDFAPKYRQGVGKDLDQAERAGSPVEPSAVAGKFIRPGAGGKEAAADLKRILGEDGEKAARDYVLADMAKVVSADGRINPARLKTWINQRAGMFEVMPSLKAEAEGVLRDVVNKREARTKLQRELEGAALERKNLGVSTQKQIDEIRANAKLTEAQKADQIKALEQKVKDTERAIKDSPTSLLLDADPKVAAAEVFKSRDPQKAMREIVAKLKSDPDAMAGWKKALSEHFDETILKTRKSSTDDASRSPSFAELDNLFQRHDKTLREVYDAGEMNQLRRAHRLVQNLERANVRTTVGSATTEYKISEQDLRPVEIMAKLYFGQLKGGGIMRSIKISLPNIPGYNDAEKAGAVIRRMWTDPELAKHLLTTPAPGPSAARWNRKLNMLMGVQQAGVESSDGE